VWAAEREKIMQTILNFVRYDAENAAAENRCPAFFEQTFGGDSAVDLGAVRVRGKIDRIDLLFNEAGELGRIRVLDYKGSSRVRSRREDYIDEIRRNLDCQLPVYALAAQQLLLGESNTPRAHAMTEAGYLFYQREYRDLGRTLNKSLLALDEAGLMDGFFHTLQENVCRLKEGDFAVDPLIETYNDYQSVCRVVAVDRESLQ
jgi:ATP-dependent helicase/DNAse subunit B